MSKRARKARTRKAPFARRRELGAYQQSEAKTYAFCGGTQPYNFSPFWTVFPKVGLTGEYTTMSDVVTPGYRELKARGVIINNAMSRVTMKLTPNLQAGRTTRQAVGTFLNEGGVPGYRYANYSIYGDWMSHLLGALSDGRHESLLARFPPPFSVTALINAATIQAKNRVQPAQAQSWVTAMESHKTIDMLVDRTRKLAKTVSAVRVGDVVTLQNMYPRKRTRKRPDRVVVWDDKGNPVTRKSGKTENRWSHPPVKPTPSKMDKASELWLEFRYGWSPLVHDIVDTLKAMYAEDLRQELIKRERVTARGLASNKGQTSSTSSSSANWAFGTLTATSVAEHECTVRAYILYEPIANFGLRRLNDFGAFDVPRAIWELVPWSFVIDWFIPIGDWLGALTPKVGVNVLAEGYEVVQKCAVTRTVSSWVSIPATGDLKWTESPIPIGDRDSVVADITYRHPFLITPSFPPVDVRLNIKRLVDAVALLKSVR